MNRSSSKPNNFKHFVGIDISKNKLDICLIKESGIIDERIIPNAVEAIRDLLIEFKKLPAFQMKKTLFCMDNTGIYGNHLLQVFQKVKANLVVENGLHIKQSIGLVRDKSDKKDAARIAVYAMRHSDQAKLWQPPRPVILQLRHLGETRDRLVGLTVRLKNPSKEQQLFLPAKIKKEVLSLSVNSLEALKSDILNIEKVIDDIINADERIARLNKIVMSVPGIGRHTALQLIIKTNEFISYNDPDKFACYAGVVPFISESGLQTARPRVSQLANRKMKSLLHICAVRVVRFEPELRQYYLRKTVEEKKSKMSVINAVRNKLIKRVFACVKEDRLFVTRGDSE